VALTAMLANSFAGLVDIALPHNKKDPSYG
jgi:hypothetical protein